MGKEVWIVKRVSSKNAVRTAAKIIGIVAVSLCIGAIVTIILESVIFVCLQGLTSGREEEKTEERYVVMRLSAESNSRGDEEFYIYRDGKKIYCYSLKTKELEGYDINLSEGERITCDTVAGSQVYYVLSNHIVRWFDCEKQIDEEVLSEEDIGSMCGLTAIPDELSVTITRTKKNWLLIIDGYEEEAHYYICPIDGNMKTDCVEVNTLFPQEDRTGGEQVVLYRGMRIRRYYDAEKEEYCVIEIGEKEGRPKVFNSELRDTATIRVGGKLISLGYQRNNMSSYWIEGDSEERKIGCLQASAFDSSVIQPDKIMAENEELIGLVQLVTGYHTESWDPPQDELRYDVLFHLDPKTGESGILYSPWNKNTRIVGYQDGVIYLLRNFKIYSRAVENEEEKQITELPKDTYYKFDWQGDYLIVINQDGIYGAYKVR